MTPNRNFKIITFFIKKFKYRKKSQFLSVKPQLSWKSDVLEFFCLRHHFQHLKIFKKHLVRSKVIEKTNFCKLV